MAILMVVGALSLRIFIPCARSLKTKRRAIRSIKDRLRAQFNVSVAEVDAQDVWQTAVLAVSAVGTDRAYIEGMFDKVQSFVRSSADVELGRCEREFF